MTKNGYGYSIIRDGTVNIIPQEIDSKHPEVLYFILDDPLAIRDLNFYYRDKDYLNVASKKFLSQFEQQ